MSETILFDLLGQVRQSMDDCQLKRGRKFKGFDGGIGHQKKKREEKKKKETPFYPILQPTKPLHLCYQLELDGSQKEKRKTWLRFIFWKKMGPLSIFNLPHLSWFELI